MAVWHQEVLPFSGGRPKLVGTKERLLLLLYTDEEQLFIAKGLPNSRRSRWQWSQAELPIPHSICGEALLDLPRWEAERTLSVYGQEEPARTIRTWRREPIDGFPSPLNVVDYRLTENHSYHSFSSGEDLSRGANDPAVSPIKDQ
jgi:hypothetical protein